MKKLFIGIIFQITLFGSIQFSTAQLYNIVDLGPCAPYAINNEGQIVGEMSGSAFLRYSDGTITNLGSLPGSPYSSTACSVNDNGTVVGYSYIPPNGSITHAFLWSSNSGMIDLGTLGGSDMDSQADGINNSNQVVGYSQIRTTNGPIFMRAFLWSSKSGMINLGLINPTDTDSRAYSINNSGKIVGESFPSSGNSHAFLSNSNRMTDLSFPVPFNGSTAYSINDENQIVGCSVPPGISHALWWNSNSNKMVDIGTLGGWVSIANSINNKNQIVGYSYIDPIPISGVTPTSSAFLYSGSELFNLNSLISTNSGWYLHYAIAINDNGQIIGWGTNPSGQSDGFLLNLVSSPTLTINISNHYIILEWSTNFSNFILESTTNLLLSHWNIVSNTPTITNGNYTVILPTVNKQMFFRLYEAIQYQPVLLTLNITNVSNYVILTWGPAANVSSSFILESTPSLAPTAVWNVVSTNSPAIIEGQYTVTNSISGPSMFFRLRLN